MDLTSLPDEMLANVFKYTDYVTTATMRKMNYRADMVAKAFDVGIRLPVQKMSCYHVFRGSEFECRLVIDSSILCYIDYVPIPKFELFSVSVTCSTKNTTHLEILDDILLKIKIRRCLYIHNYFTIDDRLLECFLKNRKSIRNVFSLEILSTKYICSSTAFQKFFESMKTLRSIFFSYPEGDTNVFFEDGTLGNRSWEKIHLLTNKFSHPYSKMNDDFLLKVVKNCESFYTVCNSFTVEGVIQLIEAHVEEKFTTKSHALGIIQCHDALLEQAKKRIEYLFPSKLVCEFINTLDGVLVQIFSRNSTSYYLPNITFTLCNLRA